MDISLPEVQAMHQNARFFKEGLADLVEISFVGVKDTVIKKVTPQHMAQFRAEWDAYCDGKPPERRKGTALTEIMNDERAAHYFSRNVHNLEEVATLSDAQCQNIGHGTLTERAAAHKLLTQRKLEEHERARKAVSDAAATIGPVPTDKYASSTELEAVNAKIDALATSIQSLVQAIAEKPKRGRPPKTEAED